MEEVIDEMKGGLCLSYSQFENGRRHVSDRRAKPEEKEEV